MGARRDEETVTTGVRGWWRRTTAPWPLPAFTAPGEHAVELVHTGDRPVAVVRAVRQITGWSLTSATDATRSTPVLLATDLSHGSAYAAVRVLAEAGATADVVPSPARL
ncbi:ribosomal protein L7/L12 [Nocardioides zeae]|uniref:Ribosomal protein L7/L12 n=1 Tax=Nocardioides imazamoxiresistens TaxID=3231893 RepID=A0ABU3PZI7_9ACTN|nr:ribosomal protein L7/L12 [Nocardioides zeae]MDT9594207.1 ribosomal protein L7/L12 [Nocardioides zeae]